MPELNMQEVELLLLRAVRRGMERWCELVKGEAQRRAPVLTGRLRESARTQVEVDQALMEVAGQISFNTPYAVPQHEGFWKTGPLAGVEIKNHPLGGQSKYLEGPVKEFAHLLPIFVKEEIEKIAR